MLVAETFRMGGHATHDEREARAVLPAALFAAWGARDPVGLYEEYLKEEGHTARELETVERDVTAEIERAAAEALVSRERMPPGAAAVAGVYATRS
jgi:TPP-dependent pyruvate/acetoin dehydrogenase alpha subunit